MKQLNPQLQAKRCNSGKKKSRKRSGLSPLVGAGLALVLLAVLASPARAQQITLVSFPRVLVPVTSPVQIRWQEQVSAWLEYGSRHGEYPNKTTATGTGALQFIPQQEGMTGGIYYCRVSNGLLHSGEFPLIIESPQAPVMRSPQNGAVVSTALPRFEWNAVPGVPFYHLIVSDQPVRLTKDPDGNLVLQGANIVYQAITAGTDITYGAPDPSGFFTALNGLVPPLLNGKTYNWIVLNNYGNNPALTSIVQSGVQAFTVSLPGGPGKPALQSPAPGSQLSAASFTFRWGAASGAASYQFVLYELIQEESSTSTYPVWQIVTTGTSLEVPLRQVCKSGHYEWEVVALDETGKGTASDKWNFTYDVPHGELRIVTYTAAGEVLPRANVRLVARQGSGENNEYLTSDYGWITLNVQPGTYQVTAYKSGFRDSTVAVEVEVNQSTRVNFYLNPLQAKLLGQVQDGEGNPVAYADVVATGGGAGLRRKTQTDNDGRFELALGRSVYAVFAEKVGFSPGDTAIVDLRNQAVLELSQALPLRRASARLTGRVISSSGAPILGAAVQARQGTVSFTTTSDGQGNFQLELPPGQWEIRAEKPGFSGSGWRTVQLAAGEILTLSPDLVLQPGAAIVAGLVTDGLRGIPGVAISAQNLSGEVTEASTNGKGNFLFSLAPGSYGLTFRHPQYLLYGPVQLQLAAGQSVADLVVELTPAPAQISGRVTSGGSPLPGTVVRAGSQQDTTNLLGQFQLFVSPGTYTLQAQRSGYFQQELPEVTVAPGQQLSGVELELFPDAAVIRGTVRSGNSPLPLADVFAVKGSDTLVTQSAADGGYRFSVAAGIWNVSAQKTGYTGAAVQGIAVNAGQTISGVDLNLNPRRGSVAGVVRNAAGDPVARAAVSAEGTGLSAVSGGDGGYALLLPPGTYKLVASAEGYFPAEKAVSVAAGGQQSADFVLSSTAAVLGRVVDGSGTPVNRAEVTAVQAGDTLQTFTDYAGEFRFDLHAGSAVLHADKLGFSPGEKTISLTTGAAQHVVLVLQANPAEIARISGRIYLDGKSPLAGALLELSGKESRRTQTDVWGIYEFDKVEAGFDYLLRPTKARCFFVPRVRRYAPLQGAQENQNFTASYYGDLSGNQEVSAFDGSLVLRISARKDVSPYFTQFPRDSLAADVSGNGKVTSFDASLIFRYAVGLIDRFPAEESAAAAPAKGGGQEPWPVRLAVRWRDAGNLTVAVLAAEPRAFFSLDAHLKLPVSAGRIRSLSVARALSSWQVQWSLHGEDLYLSAAGATRAVCSDTLFVLEAEGEAGLRPDGIALKELYLDEENVLAEEVTPRYPARFSLSSAFPNPFNGEVRFELSVPAPEGGRPSRLGVEVFDLLGRRVAVILKGALPPGVHRLSWSGTDSAGRALPSGLYFVRARYGKQIQMRKVLLVR